MHHSWLQDRGAEMGMELPCVPSRDSLLDYCMHIDLCMLHTLHKPPMFTSTFPCHTCLQVAGCACMHLEMHVFALICMLVIALRI